MLCKSIKSLQARLLHAQASTLTTLDVKKAALVVQKLSKIQDWKQALAVLESVVTQQPQASIVYNAAMDACRRAENWQMAVCMLDNMHVRKLADVVSFNIAISACTSMQEMPLRILSQMQSARLRPDIRSFAAAASSCEVHATWRIALQLMTQPDAPNVYLLTSALGACGRGKEWQRALKILFSMGSHRIQPSTTAFNSAMSACGQARHWQLSLKLLQEMKRHRLTPNTVTFGAAVNACGRVRLWRQILGLLALMGHSKLQANSWILNGTAWACGRARHRAHAVQLPSKSMPMLDWQIAVHVFAERTFCNDALGAISRLGKPNLTLMLLLDVSPKLLNLVSFMAGLEACHRSNSHPATLAVPLAQSLHVWLRLRHGCWGFRDDVMDYGGNAVLAFDFLHSMHPCLQLLPQFFCGSLFRAVVHHLALLRSSCSPRYLCREHILERQFSLGSHFTPPALGQLGLAYRRNLQSCPSHVDSSL